MADILDTTFEGKEVVIEDNKIDEGDDINLLAKDPTLSKIIVGAGWDINTFDTDSIDLDISLFLLNRDNKTRNDNDFVFYNQPETLDGGITHNGDSRTGAGDGDDESILIDLHAVPFDIIDIAVVMSIYKGYEKEQALESVRNTYVRILNAENSFELMRFEIGKLFEDKTETGAVIGMIRREGPKWHFKADIEFVPGGLSELARRYDIIINQE